MPFSCENKLQPWLFLPAGSFTETEHGEVTFSDITTPVLERVCQYFYYKMLNQNPYVYLLLFLYSTICKLMQT